MEKKTSKEWLNIIPDKYRLKILDPDGWDRKNYDFSFNQELITFEEFMNRVSSSTVECSLELFNDF
jgi:hypothetical protein